MTETVTPAIGPSRLSVSVVIPVFNGAETVGEVVSRSREALARCAANHEFVLVNDGSADDSWERIEALAASAPDVRGVDLARNYGQHNALLAGIREARCEVVVTIDDDLQNPPEEIPKLLGALTDDCDVVYGEPIAKRQGIGRRMATRVIVRALGFLGGKTAPMVSSFRAFRTDLRDGFADYTGPDVSIDGLLTWRTERFRSVRVRHDPRVHGESNYSLTKLIRHALTMITAFSTRPLRIATTLGFFVLLFGIAVLAYVLLRFLVEGHSVPGFPFLASIISIFSGAQLFAIGVIGEYLARMHVRVMSMPSYSIRARAEGRSARATVVPVSQNPPGAAGELCRMLDWDSEFWGFPVARVIPQQLDRTGAEQVEGWCAREGVRCTFLLADAADPQTAAAAEGAGFRLVDTRVTLEHTGKPDPHLPSGEGLSALVREATPSDEAAAAAIARAAHTDTRFFFDSRFDPDKAREMYATWVRRGFGGDRGPPLVAERDGSLAGYVLLGEDPYRIELIAVAEPAQGSGIGSALVTAALERAPDGVTRVVTQARNVAAMRLYQAAGFKVTATEAWYHRWS